jgi:alcohol dehydrogenase, propanol-preferring
MNAWRVDRPGLVAGGGFGLHKVPVPVAGDGELLVRVLVCGVCRTDLHVIDGDLPARRPGVVPGHEVVGEVVSGPGFAPGTRVGVPWLRATCGSCRHCVRGTENLCPESRYTGWDADGGYAEYVTVPVDYAYALPDGYTDRELAPLLCAGISGYRALRLAEAPAGGVLGIYGFGSSAHMAAQIAIADGLEVHVVTRSQVAQRLALELGASWVGGPAETPPRPLDAAISFTPSGDVAKSALTALDHGGTLVLSAIHVSDLPSLNYERHLFHERRLRSVRANTRQDGRDLFEFAAKYRLEVSTTAFPLERADEALAALATSRGADTAVLVP